MKPNNIDFKALVTTNNSMTLNFQTRMIDELKKSFTEEEQKWYVANFYVYLHYHPTNEYPINLENVYKLLGFTTKGNAKRVLENNFTIDEDYKSSFIPTDKREIGGSMIEEIMLNVDTFKNLCMLIKTEKGKEIRKYYVKLENIFNNITNEERLQYEKQLIKEKEKVKELTEKIEENAKMINELELKPETEGFTSREPGEIYCITDTTKPRHFKIGIANRSITRVDQLNVGSSTQSLKLYTKFETFDRDLAEKLIHHCLHPFRIKNRKEWFYFRNDVELAYAINTMKKSLEFMKQFDIKNYTHFKELTVDLNVNEELIKPDVIKVMQKDEENKAKEHLEKIRKININTAQQGGAQTGNFKGSCFDKSKNIWVSQLQNNKKNYHLGYFTDEIDAAKAYNDFALYLNTNENTNYLLNDIPGYKTVARNIPEINKKQVQKNKSSIYTGVSYDSKRKHYVSGIQINGKTYNLGSHQLEIECAKSTSFIF
jgi:phage anti-repressor protein